MEVWKDYQTGKFYKIDLLTGKQSPSNKFSLDTKTFSPYLTGYPREISPKSFPQDELYSVQPKKFDGYCQFPRPPEKISKNLPYPRLPSRSLKKVYIKDFTKIPKPLTFLRGPSKGPRSTSPIRYFRNSSISQKESEFNTIDELKKSFMQMPNSSIKTFKDLRSKLSLEKISAKGYSPPPQIEKKRKLKGKFLKQFKTSAELSNLEKKIREVTNPSFFRKLANFNALDKKILEKRHHATKLLQIASNY